MRTKRTPSSIMTQGGRERLNDKWRGLRVFSAAEGEACPKDPKGTIADFEEWWTEDEHGKKLKPPMYVSVVEDDDGERWPIGVASLPEMVLAADDQPRIVRLESNEAMRDMGAEEVAESDRTMAAMSDDTQEDDEDDGESSAAPEASATSSETPAAKDQRHVQQRRSSRFCADGGARCRCPANAWRLQCTNAW